MGHVVSIADPDDPRLADYRDVRERDLTGRAGLFVAEGRVVIEKAVRARPDGLVSMLVAAHRLESVGEIIAALPAETPVYAAEQPVMDRIAGFPIHRGLLAIGRRSEQSVDVLLAGLPEAALVVCLVGIANHDNMGGIFRNAAAFGAAAVLLDETCCDPLYRKAIRVGVGAPLVVPFARGGHGASLVERLREAGFRVVSLSPSGAVDLRDLAPASRTAALFGAEGPGLPPAILARTESVRIPMAGGFDSLNVATTSGIVLHQLVSRSNADS